MEHNELTVQKVDTMETSCHACSTGPSSSTKLDDWLVVSADTGSMKATEVDIAGGALELCTSCVTDQSGVTTYTLESNWQWDITMGDETAYVSCEPVNQ